MYDSAYYEKILKISRSHHEKEAAFETARIGLKALKESILGGTKLKAPPGMLLPERKKAVAAGTGLMDFLKSRGTRIHRARVKSPSSLEAGQHVVAPDDLLGLQAYAKSPEDVESMLANLRESGASVSSVKPVARKGYHGVNIKGEYDGTPYELQAVPGVISNMGQIMEHSLGYKPELEAPKSNAFDKWFGKSVAPKMVNWDEAGILNPSWIKRYKDKIEKLGSDDSRRKRHGYYMRNRNRILQQQRQYRAKNRAQIARRQKIYRRRVSSGQHRQRQRIGMGNSYTYGGYR